MLYYALVFLIVGLIAGALGLAGIAVIAGQISWILFLIGIVLLVLHLLTGRRLPPALWGRSETIHQWGGNPGGAPLRPRKSG